MEAMAQRANPSGAFSVVLPTLAALLFLAALMALFTGLTLAFPGPRWIPLWNLNRDAYDSFHRMGWIAVIVLVTVACIAGVAAVGLALHKRWAWRIALLLFVVNGTGDLVSAVRTHEAARFGSGVLIAAAFVILLTLPQVRRSVH
jgi:hypothetical protein